MSLVDQLNQDMKQAMKDGDKVSLSTIRLVKSSLSNEQIALGRELTEEDELTVLSREMKQRQESLSEFEKSGRQDLITGIQNEIATLRKYMPEQMDESQVRQLVEEAISETGAASPKDMGKVMGVISPKVKGRADGKMVSEMVKEILNS